MTDTGLKRYHLTKKANKKGYSYKNYLCGTCARTKLTRKQFKQKDEPTHTRFLEKVTCDIAVYLNSPSREGWKYILVFTDDATKMIWTYGLIERTSTEVVRCLKDMMDNELPDTAKIEHFHTDGGKELISEQVRLYLKSKGTRKITNTPTETPELNSVSERKFRTLGEMALAMLSRSGLPIIWWGKAYMAAQYILRRMPTKTSRGFMTPLEAIPHGKPPSWKWLRVWGCKAYVLKPGADRRKDWDDKAQVGYFMGYSQDTVGWEIYLPASNTMITSVNVLFDEKPPDRTEEYYKELELAAKVFVDPESESVADYQHLVNSYHIDDEDTLLYQVKRVEAYKGYIVAFRAQVTGDKHHKVEKAPIHIKDVLKMTNATDVNKKADLKRKADAEKRERLLRQPHVRGSNVDEMRPTSEFSEEDIATELATRTGAGSTSSKNSDSAKRFIETHGGSEDSSDQQRDDTNKNSTQQIARGRSAIEKESDEVPLLKNGDTIHKTVTAYDLPKAGREVSSYGKRNRVQRKPVNIGAMGEVNQVEIPHERHVYMSKICRYVYTSNSQELVNTKSIDVDDRPEIEPLTHAQAMESKEWRHWAYARDEENRVLQEKDTMILVKKTKGMKTVKSKYVFKIKRKYGKITRYKARLVALGYDEQVNPSSIFAPVVKPNTVRLLMALAQTEKMQIHQIDIQNAFCCANIEGDVYMEAPVGMDIPEGHCFKLKKSLYGLKSAPKSWNKLIDKTLKSLHFKPTVSDPCLYSRWSGGKQYLILVYVDDILIAGERVEHIQEIKDSICDKFAMTDMGPLDNFLNANITQTPEKITVDQTHYCREILETFNFLVKGKTSKTPLPIDAIEKLAAGIDITAEHDTEVASYPYRQVVGSLLYLAMYTKPEISYAVGVLSRFNDKKTKASCDLATHLLRYLNAHRECIIEFSGTDLDIHAFSDADWAGDILTRRSTTGYIVFAAGGPISWQSKLQTTVATSSMESEYMALYAGMQELVWIRGVLKELGRPLDKPTPFLVDSKSAKDLALNPVFHSRSKHIDIKYHWLRQHTCLDITDGFRTATLYHCVTAEMTADIFTKSLSGNLFFHHANSINGKRKRSSYESIQKSKKPGGAY